MAQSIAGTDLATTADAVDRKPVCLVEVQWDRSTWTDETDRVFSMNGHMSLSALGASKTATSGGVSNTLSITMRNEDNRYSPNNSSSPLYDDIKEGGIHMTPIRVSMGFYSGATAETLRQFTGVFSYPGEATISKTCIWDCSDDARKYNEDKVSTAVSEDVFADSFIAIICDAIGITSGRRSLDAGICRIPYAWTDEENALSEIVRVAAADGGMAYFDKDSDLRFENAFHWVDGSDHTTSQYTFTTSAFANLDPEYTPEEVFAGIIIERSPYEEGGLQIVYARDDPLVIDPSSDKDIVARLDMASTNVFDPVAETDYVAITRGGRRIKTGGATPVYLSDDITITGTKYGQRVDLVVSNANANYTLYLIKFQLRGLPLIGAPSDEVRYDTVAGYAPDERKFELRGNQYIQTDSQGEMLGEMFRDRLERTTEIFHNRAVKAIPWLEFGDRVTEQEADSGISKDAYVVEINWSFNGRAYVFDDLVSIAADYLFPVTDYFRANTDSLGYASGQTTTDIGSPLKSTGTDHDKLAVEFTMSSAITLRSAELKLKRINSPGGNIRLVVYSDTGGLPNAAITDGASRWVATSSVPTQNKWIPFLFSDEPTLSNGSTYHLVLEANDDYDYSAGRISWRQEAVGAGAGNAEWYDPGPGADWFNNISRKPAYRVYENPLFY